MKPKEYLEWLNAEISNATDDYDFAYKQGLYKGAEMMWHLFRDKSNAWHDANREKIRAYNTQYQRERRARLKAMKEDIDKISMMS